MGEETIILKQNMEVSTVHHRDGSILTRLCALESWFHINICYTYLFKIAAPMAAETKEIILLSRKYVIKDNTPS